MKHIFIILFCCLLSGLTYSQGSVLTMGVVQFETAVYDVANNKIITDAKVATLKKDEVIKSILSRKNGYYLIVHNNMKQAIAADAVQLYYCIAITDLEQNPCDDNLGPLFPPPSNTNLRDGDHPIIINKTFEELLKINELLKQNPELLKQLENMNNRQQNG